MLLVYQGYDISEASNGNQAIHVLGNEHFNLIVSDILMSYNCQLWRR
jgi:hypothetical protein